jgi:hypothetical protein
MAVAQKLGRHGVQVAAELGDYFVAPPLLFVLALALVLGPMPRSLSLASSVARGIALRSSPLDLSTEPDSAMAAISGRLGHSRREIRTVR